MHCETLFKELRCKDCASLSLGFDQAYKFFVVISEKKKFISELFHGGVYLFILFVLQIFFLQGRFIFGPDVRSLGLTIFLIVAPVAVFCVFVAKKLMDDYSHHWGISIMVVAVVFTVYVGIFFQLFMKLFTYCSNINNGCCFVLFLMMSQMSWN